MSHPRDNETHDLSIEVASVLRKTEATSLRLPFLSEVRFGPNDIIGFPLALHATRGTHRGVSRLKISSLVRRRRGALRPTLVEVQRQRSGSYAVGDSTLRVKNNFRNRK